jgi:hypothetical protein
MFVSGDFFNGRYKEIKFNSGKPDKDVSAAVRNISLADPPSSFSSKSNKNGIVKKFLPTLNDGLVLWVKGISPAEDQILYLDQNGFSAGSWLNTKSNLSGGVFNNAPISAVAVMINTWFLFQNNPSSTGFHFDVTNPAAAASAGPTINGQGLGMIITAAVGRKDRNILYMANYMGEVLVSTGNPKTDFTRVTLVSPASLVIEGGVDNKNIGSLAVVGEKLLIGMRRVAQTQTGGVAIIDLTGDNDIKPTGAIDVRNIDAGADDKTALISSDRGLIFFDGDKLITIPLNAPSEIDKVKADSPWHFAKKPAELDLSKSVGATQFGNTWYIGTDTGVYPMTIEVKTKK